MKIGVDAREIQNGVITGIGRSLANFIKYFERCDSNNTLVLFSEKRIDLDSKDKIENVVLKSKLGVFFWDQWILPRGIKANGIRLFYSPYYKVPLLTSIPVVNQILDLMFLAFPKYRQSLGCGPRFYYELFGKAFARKSVSTITDSNHAKRDIIRLWNINANKIRVIPLGLSNRYKQVKDANILEKVKRKFTLPDKYILYLGNFKPHKNVKSLVYAFKKIEQKYSNYQLVLAGPLDEYGCATQKLVADLNLSQRVLFTNTVREEDYPEALLSMAEMFVFPTLYEGFGLPPLEAMACGTPVVASNLTSVPEVVGNAGLLINPSHADEISQAISDFIENPAKRKTYSDYGLKRASQFREKDTTAKLYHHIISIAEKIQ